MANEPSYDSDRFSFGPGILYMGVEGTTPLIDIGAVKGDADFTVTRERLEIFQGSPQSKVKQYATKEEAVLKVTGIEWNLTNIAYAIGAGTTGDDGKDETLEFGGAMTMSDRALRFVHIQPDGSTIDLHIFNAEGGGSISIAFKETDTHEFPFEFHALTATTDFEAVAVATNKKKFKIIRTRA